MRSVEDGDVSFGSQVQLTNGGACASHGKPTFNSKDTCVGGSMWKADGEQGVHPQFGAEIAEKRRTRAF